MQIDRAHLEAAPLARWLTERPRVRVVRFGTFDELWCSADFHVVASADCESDLHAFVLLWRARLEAVEEMTIGTDHVAFFLGSFDAGTGWGPAASFAPLSDEEWGRETSEVTEGIRAAIVAVRSGERLVHGKRLAIPDGPLDLRDVDTYWGVFDGGARVPESAAFPFLERGCVVDGVAVRLAWNDRELFVKTATEYVLFSWGTGA